MFYRFLSDNIKYTLPYNKCFNDYSLDKLTAVNTNMALYLDGIGSSTSIVSIKHDRQLGYSTVLSLYALYFALTNRNSIVCLSSPTVSQSNMLSGIMSQVLCHNNIEVDISSNYSCILIRDCNSTLYFCQPGYLLNRFSHTHNDLLIIDELLGFSTIQYPQLHRLLTNSSRFLAVLSERDFETIWKEDYKSFSSKPLIIL